MFAHDSRMRLAACLAAAVTLWAFAASCAKKPATTKPASLAVQPPNDVEEIGWMRLDPGPRPPASMLAVKPAELPAHYRSLYRIKPDRRILYAFAEIDRLLAGRHVPSILSVRFEEGRWRLLLGQEDVGTLPEIPTWSDAHRLLVEWTALRRKRTTVVPSESPVPELGALQGDLGQGTPAKVLAALRTLNALAAERPLHPQLVRAAAHGTVWLTLQTYDYVRQSDPLMGHALALLVLAQSLQPDSLAEDEALLARVMGYETAAAGIAERLTVGDPVRLWVRFDAAGLAKVANAPDATPRTQYLMLLEASRRGGREAFFAAFRNTVWARETSTTSLGLLGSLGDFDLGRVVPQALAASAYLSVAALDLSSPSDRPAFGPEAWPDRAIEGLLSEAESRAKAPLESQTKSFEDLVQRRASEWDGSLLDRESTRAFYRSAFYSGIRGTAWFLFDQYGSNTSAEAYANSIKDPAPGTATELRDWMLTRSALARARISREEGIKRVEPLRRLGVSSVALVVHEATRGLGSGTHPLKRIALKLIARGADTRPGDLYEAWEMARQLSDVRLAETYSRALVDQAPVTGGDMILRLAYWTRDASWLRRIAADPQQTTSNRTYALVDLALMDDPDTAFRKARYLELMREQPENTDPLEKCVNLLRNANDLSGADRVIREWLDRRPTAEHDLTWAHVLTMRADLLANQKKWDAALKLLRPAATTGKAEVLLAGARYQEALDRWDEAFATAKNAHDRYPEDAWSEDIMARILWRQHRYDEAAALLAGSHNISRRAWEGTIAESFGQVFEKSDPHDAQNALAALRNRKVEPKYLAAMARDVGTRGNHKLAFGLLSSIPATGPDESAIQIWCYDELEKTDGKEAAVQWLRKNVRIPHQLAMVAFQFQRYDILWEPLEDPARPRKEDEIQVLRAASLIHSPSADDNRRKLLIEYFDGRPKPLKDFPAMGLFLLGKTNPQDLIPSVAALGVSNAGWVLGLRAAAEGRYEEASDWLEVAVEAAKDGVPPGGWCVEILYRWWEKSRFLADLAREKVL